MKSSSQQTPVSVVMPVYNAEKYLRPAIESVLHQTFPHFEFIIINDGSSDDSLKIIQSYTDNRIVLIDQENKGLAASLNTGIRKASGKYIARMDADDICLPGRLEKQFAYLEKHPNVKLLGSNIERIDDRGNHVSFEIPYTGSKGIKKILFHKGNPFKHPTVMMCRKAVLDAGGYNEDIGKHFEDYFLWGKIASKHEIDILPHILLQYRIVPNSIMSYVANDDFLAHVLQIVQKGEYSKEDQVKIKQLLNAGPKITHGTSYQYRIDLQKKALPNRMINILKKIIGLESSVRLLSFCKRILT